MSTHNKLSVAKGLGSAKHGSGHWLAQRFSAISLIPLVAWFVLLVMQVTSHPGITIITILSNPINAVLMILFIGTVLYHGTLGIQVMIEDYVSCECAKTAAIFITRVASIITMVALFVAVLTFHVNHVKTTPKDRKVISASSIINKGKSNKPAVVIQKNEQ